MYWSQTGQKHNGGLVPPDGCAELHVFRLLTLGLGGRALDRCVQRLSIFSTKATALLLAGPLAPKVGPSE